MILTFVGALVLCPTGPFMSAGFVPYRCVYVRVCCALPVPCFVDVFARGQGHAGSSPLPDTQIFKNDLEYVKTTWALVVPHAAAPKYDSTFTVQL